VTAVVDYGVGNLFSLMSSLGALGIEAEVTADPGRLEAADRVILPGVGAFGDASDRLKSSGLNAVLRRLALAGQPLLGICLGMQLLFDESREFGEHKGLGLVPGIVTDMSPRLIEAGFRYGVPQIGWNALSILRPESPLMKYSRDGDSVYYVHSYSAEGAGGCVVATSEYGIDVVGVVQNGSVFGTQFHPEKSGAAGLKMLKAFSEISRADGGA
jgi:glutamine amidotransferase